MKKASLLFSVILNSCSTNKEMKKQAANERKVELTISAVASLLQNQSSIKILKSMD